MRRRKATTMQVNARLETELVDRLAMRAKENRASLSEEIKTRLINSFEPEPGAADFRGSWVSQLRDTLEADVPKEKIEEVWDCLREIDAEFAKFYGFLENKLSTYVRYPRVRELLRGKTKAARQE